MEWVPLTPPLFDPSLLTGDWSQDAAAPAQSPVWASDLLGGSIPGACIPSGPYAGMLGVYPPSISRTPPCVWRGFTHIPGGQQTMGSGALATWESTAALQVLVESPNSYATFRSAVESVHGSVHVAIGRAESSVPGDMASVFISNSDPVFYLHHAYIDALWARWQAVDTRDATEYNNFGATPAAATDALPPFPATTVADTFDLPCVRYAAAPVGDGFVEDADSVIPPRGEVKRAVAADRAAQTAATAAWDRAAGRSRADVAAGADALAEAVTTAILARTLPLPKGL